MKTTYTFVLCLLVIGVSAQTERHSWHLGGGMNINFNTNQYEFVPNGIHLQQGYFVKKNLLIGLHLSSNYFAISRISNQGNDPQNYIDYKKRYINGTATPFVRYFLGKSNWRPYFEGQLGVSYKSVKQLYNDPTQNFTIAQGYYPNAAIGLGFAYFPRKNWGLDLGLSYQVIDKSPDETYWSSPLIVRIGLRSVISKK